MKLTYQLVTASLVLLAWNACQKEYENPETNRLSSEQTITTGANLTGCDDTSAFKSIVDLQPLEYLKGCYSCTAVKEVPGLGAIPWVGNCGAAIVWDTVLVFGCGTSEEYFGQFLPREKIQIHIGSVPMNVGLFTIFDYDQWQQNQSLSFGSYARVLDDGDVGDGLWGVDTTCTNYIEITRLDLEDMEIEGNFELHLKMSIQGSHGILYSERINFLNGRFKGEIFD